MKVIESYTNIIPNFLYRKKCHCEAKIYKFSNTFCLSPLLFSKNYKPEDKKMLRPPNIKRHIRYITV